MLYLGDGRLINCYNNGKIAIWNLHSLLSNNLEPVALKQIHSSFTYKIRRVDPETVLTCSNDGCVKLIDIEQCEIIDSFQHEDGVWCAYPINQNVFCSGGLMNKLVFWDSRQKKIINKCQL
jgi:WD40 repeat protein